MGELNIEWSEKYSVGNSEIDNQHRELFELVNSIPEVVDDTDIVELIMKLYKYTRDHFAAEEDFMREIEYPNLDNHIELHNSLLEQLNDVSTQDFDTDEAIYSVKEFAFNWLSDHILKEDIQYFEFNKG